MNNLEQKQIEIFSKKENLTQIELFLDEVSKELSIGEELYGKVFLAVLEATNNAVIHGNKEDETKKVRLEIKQENNKLIIVVSDEGNGFDYDNIPDPTLPENIEKPDGRGVFVIRSLADELAFENNGAKMQMIFNL